MGRGVSRGFRQSGSHERKLGGVGFFLASVPAAAQLTDGN